MTNINSESGSGKLFGHLSRFHIVSAFVLLMALRVVVGFHFFKEGTQKVASGTFTSKHFLKAARGPFAPMYHSMLSDNDGRMRLCLTVNPENDAKRFEKYDLNSEFTFSLWNDFIDQSVSHYQFGSAAIEQKLVEHRAELAQLIQSAREAKNTSVDTRALELMRASDERDIKTVRSQIQKAKTIYEGHCAELNDFLIINRNEIIAHFGSQDRLTGFARDGDAREAVATNVASLREQVDTIRGDRQKKLTGWISDVEAIWDSLEQQITALAVESQKKDRRLHMHRPFNQVNNKLNTIDRIIPWFDTIIGALLILGLFTRVASLAAAGFLASVIASQPPWVPGIEPNYYVMIELFALLVIFATCAGQLGGLDFFFAKKRSSGLNQIQNTEGQA